MLKPENGSDGSSENGYLEENEVKHFKKVQPATEKPQAAPKSMANTQKVVLRAVRRDVGCIPIDGG